MSNFNLQNHNWCDIVFEGKNKSYGAYIIRKESDKTLLYSLLIATSAIISASLLMSFKTNDKRRVTIKDSSTITLIDTKIYKAPKQKENVVEKQKPNKGISNTIKNNFNPKSQPVITNNPIEKPININLPFNPNGSDGGTKIGVEGNSNTDVSTVTTTTINNLDEGNSILLNVDQSASYPGGINKFREYIANKYQFPNHVESEIKIDLKFVVEINGSITQVECTNSNDQKLIDEALRVFKSNTTKWTPAKHKGNFVRSEYKISIKLLPPTEEE